jgi:hypothetical protein
VSARGRRTRVGWLLAGLLVLLAMRANAEPVVDPVASMEANDHRPWAAGVSRAEQEAALELYVSGNHEFAEARFAQALAKYREAIRHWDHPAIRFNMAVCLIQLDLPIEAMNDLQRSLVFGEGPIGSVAYAEALTYRKLLDAQLAHLTIRSREPGTQITVDGKHPIIAPATLDEFLLPGEHQVVATRAGFVTVTRTLVLGAGKQMSYEIPALEVKMTALVRRWPPWVPWLVLAGGGAMVGGGALSYAAASTNFASYDRDVAARCPHGCDAVERAAFPDLARRRSRADTEQAIAFSLFAAGGVAVVTGVVGLVLNSPRMQVESIRSLPVVTPLPGGAVLSAAGEF